MGNGMNKMESFTWGLLRNKTIMSGRRARILHGSTTVCPIITKPGWLFWSAALPPLSKIVPGLYVGNFRDSKDLEQLRENNITHIISIHDNARKMLQDKEYLCIRASDSPGQNLIQFFSACNDFIHSARLSGGNVLVHCLAGVSRSVTITVAYLMSISTLHWRDALNAVRGARSIANPNFGFQRQLQNFEVERLKDERRRLREKYAHIYNPFSDEEDCRKLILVYQNTNHLADQCEVACPRQHLSSQTNRLQRQRSSSKERMNCPSSPARQHRSPNKDRSENFRPP